jgi:hypothetical protein
MREQFETVITLQAEFSGENTPAMQRRGLLIRRDIPAEIITRSGELRAALGTFGDDATAQGRDGTGRKTYVPWVRWYSPARSPSAQRGWYIVYLFHPDASGVSLCISHGSTTLENGAYVEKSDAEVAELMDWANAVVGTEFVDDTSVRRGIALGSGQLAAAYERTTVFSKFYSTGQVPADDILFDDLLRFSRPLQKLYRAQDLGLTPGQAHLDTAHLAAEIERFTAPLRSKSGTGQGRGLSPGDRKLIEIHAMGFARRWLDENGFISNDVSAIDSCDFRAMRDNEEWVIEVKGTTGGLGAVLLTPNEIALHRRWHPRNALLVVHGIQLGPDPGKVGGGELVAVTPWKIDDERLKPVCFEYRL